MKNNLYFYISNCGDGSARLRFFATEEDCAKAIELEDEGFCETTIYNIIKIQEYEPEVLLSCGLHFGDKEDTICWQCE